MSVLIKGMEMPTSCADCPLSNSLCCPLLPGIPALWAEYTNAVREKRRHSDCPLISIPPHGDLIEKNAASLTDFEIAVCDGNFREGMIMLLDKIDNAPTIIEAEEGDE